jgi:hypothetical protein
MTLMKYSSAAAAAAAVTHQGGWKEDLKHGLGRKVYANGDVYEGLWAAGKPDGPGRCAHHAVAASFVSTISSKVFSSSPFCYS